MHERNHKKIENRSFDVELLKLEFTQLRMSCLGENYAKAEKYCSDQITGKDTTCEGHVPTVNCMYGT